MIQQQCTKSPKLTEALGWLFGFLGVWPPGLMFSGLGFRVSRCWLQESTASLFVGACHRLKEIQLSHGKARRQPALRDEEDHGNSQATKPQHHGELHTGTYTVTTALI